MGTASGKSRVMTRRPYSRSRAKTIRAMPDENALAASALESPVPMSVEIPRR